MADLRLFSREFIAEFIEMYKGFPCLWQVNAKEYTDRMKRKLAYDALLTKYREVDKSANKDEVKKKIYGLRSSYRREMIKMKKSIQPGTTLDEVYKPTLWYFYLFDFLTDNDTMKEPTSTTDEAQDGVKEEHLEYDEEYDLIENDDVDQLEVDEHHDDLDDVSSETDSEKDTGDPFTCDTLSEYTSVSRKQTTPAPSTSRSYVAHKKRKLLPPEEDPDRNETAQTSEQNNQSVAVQDVQEDQFDVYGKLIAHKLRSFDKLQVTFSQRLINEILYEAEMGFLTRNCKVVDMGSP
uniref:MADF domain-containing protein n=1 Tax=Anopheles minimus TaxID=112268 RepID=A0A182WDV3_9DIPT